MAIDVSKLLKEVQEGLQVGDDQWDRGQIGVGINRLTVSNWIDHTLYALVTKHKFRFLQALLDSNLTAGTPNYITTQNSGLDVRLDDNVFGIETGRIGTTARIFVVHQSTILYYDLEDTVSEKYAFELLDEINGKRILRFLADQSGSRIRLAVYRYPKSIKSFPPDFYAYFRDILIAQGLLRTQSANLDDQYKKFVEQIKVMEKSLVDRYTAETNIELTIPLPNNDLYQYNTYQKGGVAR